MGQAKCIFNGYAMELRHIRYFLAVAEEKHISRAAERLGIQQPPLSQQIRALERELDVRLFRRHARGVELTEAGSSFLASARAILEQLERATDSTRRTARGEQGQICVGVTSTSSFHPLVPSSIRAFRETSPMVSITIEESLSNESIERLISGQMDVAFIRTSLPQQSTLTIHPLLQEPMVVALPKTHDLACGKVRDPIPFHSLANETFILYGPPGTGMYDATIAACHAAGFNPRFGNLGASTQQAPRIGSTLSLVAVGLGISIVPESLKRLNLDGVVYRSFKGAIQPIAMLNLATRRGDDSAVVGRLVSLVRRMAKSPSPA